MGQLGDLSPQASIAVGILVGLISTSVQSLGLTLQRKSHILEDEKDPDEYRRPPYRRRRWQLGMVMFIVSNLAGSTIQITTLPLPVLSTLQASGLVFNSICATLMLGEAFTRWSFGGTVLVSAGAVLIAVFGAIGEPAHNLNQLLALLKRRQFIIWMAGQATLVAAVIFGAKSIRWMNPRAVNSPRIRLVRGMAYGGVSGVLSAHSLLVAKSAVELLVRTIVDKRNEFTRWESWMILLGLVALALAQLYYLHRGLRLCSTSILYPFVFCVYNIVAILDGLIYFDQSSRLSILHALLIALGTVVLLLGVFALSWRLGDDPASRTATSHNPLTPDMRVVGDNNNMGVENRVLNHGADEEAIVANGNDSPIPRHFIAHDVFTPSRSRTPTMKNNDFLNVPRQRRTGMTESEEIWEELADDTLAELSPFSRRHSNSYRSPKATLDQEEESSGAAPSESTSLLRSNTGRSYKDRRRRSTIVTQDMNKRGRSSSQEVSGGWQRIKRFFVGRNDTVKGRRTEAAHSHG